MDLQPGRVCQIPEQSTKSPELRVLSKSARRQLWQITKQQPSYAESPGSSFSLVCKSLNMEPFISFHGPYANSLSSCNHGGPLDDDDSGYASDGSDPASLQALDPVNIYENIAQVDHDTSKTRRGWAAALIDAQWSRPATSRFCNSLHNLFNQSCRTFGILQPLALEPQHSIFEFGPRTWQHSFLVRFRRKLSPLDIESHRVRVLDVVPSLGNPIRREVDHCSPSPGSIQDGSPDSEVRLEDPGSKSSNACA